MPEEHKYESDNLQGHHEWTESERVRCRQYFRWHHLRKLQKKMVAMLNAAHISKIDYEGVGKLLDDMPFEWEIVRKDDRTKR